MWIDAHAHLYDLGHDELAAAIAVARQTGVVRILNTGVSLASSETVVRQCSLYPELYGAAGISPFDAAALPSQWQSRLEALCADSRILAVGETGMDLTSPAYPDIGLQRPLFEKQLEVARGLGFPAIIHSRGCEGAAVEACVRTGLPKALFHCFTGAVSDLRKLLEAGYYVSFSGIATFKNSPLHDAIRFAPLDRVLIETDSPYLAPVPHRGKINRPAWVVLVGKKLAEIKCIDEERAAEAIVDNFIALFAPGDLPE